MPTKVLLAGLLAVTLTICFMSGDERSARERPRIAATSLTSHVPAAALAFPAVRVQPGALRLEGQAIDVKNQPVAGARITLAGSRTAITEQDGSFAFDGLATGTYSLSAEHDAMYGEAADEHLDGTSDPVMITMRRGPTLVVQVVATDGKPIRDAKVSESTHERVTNGDGVAMFRGLDLGDTFVEIHATGFAPQRLRVELGEVPDVTVDKLIRLDVATVLEGIVVDERDHRVAGARVMLQGPGDRWNESVDSDESGRFRFEAVGPGRHSLRARSDRHLEAPELAIELEGTRPRTAVVVRVHLGAEVDGVVVDARGTPIKGAMVHVASGSSESDEAGRFLVTGLEPGTHDISAESALEGSIVSQITLVRGMRAKARIVMVPSSIAGIVRDVHGRPVEDVFVWVRDKTTKHRGFAHTDETGHFDVGGLAPGVYEVTAERRNEPSREAVVLATVRSPSRNLALVVPDALQIAGRVILDGRPVTHYGVSVTEDVAHVGSPEVVNAADGRFERAEITPGTWAVVIAGPSFAKKVVEGIVVGTHAVDLGDIIVDHGRALGGRVVDDRGVPLAGAAVEVSREGRTGDASLRAVMYGSRIVKTDRDGRYRIVGLENGDRLRISAAHARGLSRTALLPVDAQTFDLVIEGAGSIRGRIDRMVTRQYMAYAESVTDGEETYSASVDSVGGFAFDRMPAGDYTFSVHGNNTLPPQRVTVRAHTSTEVVFEMPEHPVTVRVHSAGCSIVYLEVSDGIRLGAEVCENDVATFNSVAPGPYRFCLYTACTAVNVAQGPESIDITLTPPI